MTTSNPCREAFELAYPASVDFRAPIAEYAGQFGHMWTVWKGAWIARQKYEPTIKDSLTVESGIGKAVAWMTSDGRVATDETKKNSMASTSQESFNIPLYTHSAKDIHRLMVEENDHIAADSDIALDAGRYRWIRENSFGCTLEFREGSLDCNKSSDKWDKTIDSFMNDPPLGDI